MPNHTTTPPVVTQLNVGGVEIARISYRGEPVITFAEIDRLHLRKADTASRAFRDNRERFTEGVDVVSPTSDEIRGMSDAGILPERTARVTFLTRRGYLKIVKVLSDDRAWDVQGEMIERFFAFEQAAPALAFNPADPQHVLTLVGHYAEQIAARDVRIAELEPQAATLAQLTGSGGSLSLTDAAKVLGLRRKDLLIWLGFNDWISRGQDGKLRATTDRITSGRLEQIVQKYGPDDRYATVSVRVTVSGLAELDGLIDRALFAKVKRTKAKKAAGPSEGAALLTDMDGETA